MSQRVLAITHSSPLRPAVAWALPFALLFILSAVVLTSAWAEATLSTDQSGAVGPSRKADFGHEKVSAQARHLANWVVGSADNQNMPFMVIDKVFAKVMIFDGKGQLLGSAPALLGLAKGDDSSPGIGQRKLSSIRSEEKTTPAGRFVASLDRDLHGKEMLWVDYDTAISMHPIVKGTLAEKRSQRLGSARPDDRRISYGCINVPLKFFESLVGPTFTGTSGIVYILPETRTNQEVFRTYDVPESSVQPMPLLAANPHQ